VKLANTLTGEPIKKEHELTILSGGQSRALMVADVAIISNSPIVLIDEIENAGIRKHDALKVLAGHGKIVLVVTHDPVLALMTDKRIVMRNGGMIKVVGTTQSEKGISRKLNKIDELMLNLREKVRNGEVIENIEDIEF
jgi:ABC-type lipoprotein export system ATPase subunit